MANHATQPRQPKTRRFGSHFTREQLRALLRIVALALYPQRPEKLTQREFDEHAPRLMAEKGEPPPPSARAAYMRLNRNVPGKRKSWRELVLDACTTDDVRAETSARRVRENPFIDERHVWYALRRVASFLGKTPTPEQYDEARRQLIAENERLRRRGTLVELLPTSGQILALAGPLGWAGACELAQLEPLKQPVSFRGFDPSLVVEHFYETNRRLPSRREFLGHAATLGIPLTGKAPSVMAAIAELEARRAARGLETPATGPEPGTELTPEQVEALIADAPRKRPINYWTADRVLDALVEYLDEYEHQVPLRQKHYQSVCSRHGWPSSKLIGSTGSKLNIGGFQPMLNEARRRRRARGGDEEKQEAA